MDRKLKNTLTRRRTLLMSLGAVFLVGIVYVGASFMYWQGYAKNVTTHERAKSVLEKALDKPSQTAEEKTDKLAALTAASKGLFASSTSCKPAWWVAWQEVIPAVSTHVARCETTAKKHSAVQSALDAVERFAKDEVKLATALAPLSKQPKKLTEKTWSDTSAKWQSVATEVKSLEVQNEFSKTNKQAAAQLQKVVAAWGKLAAADKKENSSDFNAAYDALDRAITDLISVADLSESELQVLTKQLENAANKL